MVSMNHLSKESVRKIMILVQEVVKNDDYSSEKMGEIFKLSEVDGEKFQESRNHPIQQNQVNFEIDPENGVRFFDPFNFFTKGIYKDMDGWSRWTLENLKEPWT
tara:strand:+ start:293 stop:604 length:312 start_codon:yes stop_codon:yes gene_type:complete